MRQIPLILAVVVFALARSQGQQKDAAKQPAPRALYALQLAADPGKTTKLTIRGLDVDSATEVRLGEPKSTGKVIGKGRKVAVPNQMMPQVVGNSEIDVEVTLPADVPGGSVPLSLFGPGGEGKPMLLLVNDDTTRVQEKEPNDGFAQAMPIAAPTIVEATFKQGQDVDVYRIEGKAGEKYRIEIQASRFGSPAEPMLALYDEAGRTITTGEPMAKSKDPLLAISFAKDGVYFISIIEGFDQGGPHFVYRLSVRRNP